MEYKPFLMAPRGPAAFAQKRPVHNLCQSIMPGATRQVDHAPLDAVRNRNASIGERRLDDDVAAVALGESSWPAKCIIFVGTGRWVQERETGDELDQFRPHYGAPMQRASTFHP
ncbi:hypothetical protein [Bradyrhizobium cenepequi]